MAPSGWGFQVTECPHPGEDEVEGMCGKFLGARAVYSTRSIPSHFVRYNSHMASPLGLLVPQTGQFKHQKFIICQFWSLEVQNQGVDRVGPRSGCDGESVPCSMFSSHSFFWFAGNL